MDQKPTFFFGEKAKKSVLLLTFFICILKANASHMAGAEISYRYSGNDLYLVKYTLYSDCSGSLPPVSVNAFVRSTGCSINQSFLLTQIAGSETVISANCISAPSTCNGGMTTGFRQIQYSGSIQLVQQCSDFVFSVTDCCRNSAINTITNPESQPLYVEAQLNNISGGNNSPVFSGRPILLLSTNQLNQLSENAIDPDGDSLVYSLVQPKTSEITNVNYAQGFNPEQYISSNTPIMFNCSNGTITVNPSRQETAILAVRISEFRNGNFIGSTMRDLQLISVNTTNTLPSIQQFEEHNSESINLCSGDEMLLNISTVDPDAGQSTSVEILSNIPDLFIQKSTDRLQKAQIKWNARFNSGNNFILWIKVIVTDNACPMNGSKTYYREVKVSHLDVHSTIVNSDCAGKDNGSIALAISSSTQPVSIGWVYNNSRESVLNNLSAGVYRVTIDNGFGCISTRTFQIDNIEKIEIISSVVNTSCNGNDGVIQLAIDGGVAPFQFIWDDNSALKDRINLKEGIYSVKVSDEIGCFVEAGIRVKHDPCETLDSELILFPNPATESISVQKKYLTSPIQRITISDPSGRIVIEKNVSIADYLNETIQVNDLAKGIYFLTVFSQSERSTLPFIKK